MQDARGVGLEGDHHRVRVLGLRPPNDLVDDVAVSAVHTVEVTDAEDRGTEVAGNIVEFVKDVHESYEPQRTQRAQRNLGKNPPIFSLNSLRTLRSLRFNLHCQISNSNFIPSNASCTPGGNAALVASCGRSWQMCVKNVRFGFTSSTIFSDCSTVEWVGCGV